VLDEVITGWVTICRLLQYVMSHSPSSTQPGLSYAGRRGLAV